MAIFRTFSLLALFFATSCVETVVVGSTVGGALIVREKTIADTKDDVVIATKMGTSFIQNGLKNPGNSIDITVNERRVLLTGIARDQEKAKLAVKLAWKVAGVKEVIDEIQLSDEEHLKPKDFSSSTYDYYLTLSVETKLLFSSVSSINFKITTVAKTVYLFGIADNEAEMQRAISIAAKTRGVKKVVNHVILADDNRRK